MDEETKAAFSAELASLCLRYNVCIRSFAYTEGDSQPFSPGVVNYIEVTRMVKRAGKHPREETLFRCEEINELGIFEN